MENLTINQIIFIVKSDSIITTSIESLWADGQNVVGRFGLKGNDDLAITFKAYAGIIEGEYTDAYHRSERFRGFTTKSDAAKYQREKILETNKQKISDVTKFMNDLKAFRIMHHELLWTEDENKWIENFEREYNW